MTDNMKMEMRCVHVIEEKAATGVTAGNKTCSMGCINRPISQVDTEILHHLCKGVKGGFDEEMFGSHLGFGCLRDYLEFELQKRYKEAATATLALLEQHCNKVTVELARMDFKIEANSDVAYLRRYAMLHAASICNHVGTLIDRAADPSPEQWGRQQKRSSRRVGLEAGLALQQILNLPMPPSTLCGRCFLKMANMLLAHAGRGGGRGVSEAAAEIADAVAQPWLAPLLDTLCDRLDFMSGNLFDLAVERNHHCGSDYGRNNGDIDGFNQESAAALYLKLCDWGPALRDETKRDQGNIPPGKNAQQATPGKGAEARDALRESHMIVLRPHHLISHVMWLRRNLETALRLEQENSTQEY
ncbi:dynamin-related protein 5A-like [Cornus florida]|uniref:dynamin-related protein 5A-like n=1 Tax=Cornus florida TaxID=4283 RepID=UPI00289A4E15|nr:dynamin-related protein 5A-like [Cornus florida]